MTVTNSNEKERKYQKVRFERWAGRKIQSDPQGAHKTVTVAMIFVFQCNGFRHFESSTK
jgi:hypothetical protein